jgi:chromosome segregation ATPase
MTEVAGPLAATTRRQQALESRLAELQVEGSEPSEQSEASDEPSPQSLAAFVLGRAHDIARQLPDHIVRDAEAERQRLEEITAQAIKTAHARSARIIGAAYRDRDEVDSIIDEARRQIDAFRERAHATATARAQRSWQEATAALAEVEVELAALRAERHAVLSELSQLERAVEASRAQLRKRDAIEADVVTPVARFELQPERHRWALMPVEW